MIKALNQFSDLCHAIKRDSSHWLLMGDTNVDMDLITHYVIYVMMTSSNENIFRFTGPLCGEFTGSRMNSHHNGQWHGALMFSLICA